MNYPKLKAKYPTICKFCDCDIEVGEYIQKYETFWVHYACSVDRCHRDRINSGETMRSYQKSSYRRGKSPGSYRSKM